MKQGKNEDSGREIVARVTVVTISDSCLDRKNSTVPDSILEIASFPRASGLGLS